MNGAVGGIVKMAEQMTCYTCKTGRTEPGRTSFVSERDDRLVVIRNAPALVCRQCGEAYFENDVAVALYEQAEKLLTEGEDVEIVKYAA